MIEQIEGKANELTKLVRELCPPSRETSLALTNIEQGILWARSSLGAREPAKEAEAPRPPKENPLDPDSLEELRRDAGQR